MEPTREPRRRPPWAKRLLRLAVTAGFLVVLAVGVLWGCQRRLLYPGVWMDPGLALSLPENAERWEHAIDGGVVQAILLTGRGATPEHPGPAIVFTHGNGEFIDQWAHAFRRFTDAGYTVLLPEYRGYGDSAGKPSQSAILDDLIMFRQRLVEHESVDPQRLIYVGRSLGSGFAAQLADRQPPAALILSSSFTSAADAGHDLTGLPRWLVRDRLDVRSVLAQYPGPVLVLHGQDDDLIGVHHAQANADATPHAQLVVYPDTGHENMPEGFGRWEDIFTFLNTNNLGTPYGHKESVAEDDDLAFATYRKEAERGVPEAMFNLAVAYHLGKGVQRDDAEAVAWHLKAAAQGHAMAMVTLGHHFGQGLGVSEDDAASVEWYRKAAELDVPEAKFNLGVAYHTGEGVVRDDAQAVAWYRQAAATGHATAMLNLGTHYEQGIGVPEDDAIAVAWYHQAADLGEVKAMYNLGVCYGFGRGVAANPSTAAMWYREAAERGHVNAMFNLGACYAEGRGVTQSDDEAAKWFGLAAQRGDAEAQTILREHYGGN